MKTLTVRVGRGEKGVLSDSESEACVGREKDET